MSNYKSKIEKILQQIAGEKMTTIDDRNKILSLFREIVKEAFNDKEICEYCCKDKYLSNIEELLK